MSRRLVVHCKRESFDVYIGRPGPWGNPFSHKSGTLARFKVKTREEAIAKYEEWLRAQPELVERARRELRSKVLGCWCAPLACHGDVLSRVAQEEPWNCQGCGASFNGPSSICPKCGGEDVFDKNDGCWPCSDCKTPALNYDECMRAEKCADCKATQDSLVRL